MFSVIARNDLNFLFTINHPWYRMKRKWHISLFLNDSEYCFTDEMMFFKPGDCLLISKSPEKKVTAVNFWKYERGDRSVHLNHVKSLTWAVRSLVIYSKWYTVSWNWWKINRIGIEQAEVGENNNVKKHNWLS